MLKVEMLSRRIIDKWHLRTRLWLYLKLCRSCRDLVETVKWTKFLLSEHLTTFASTSACDFTFAWIKHLSVPQKLKTQRYVQVRPALTARNSAFCPYAWYVFDRASLTWPTRCKNNNLLIFKLAQHVSGNSLPILRSARLSFTARGITSLDSCRSEARSCSSNILHTEHIVLVAALRASDRQLSRDIILHAVNRSLALLRMGKELPETCLANLKINKLLLLHLVGHLIYLCPYTVYM